MRDEGSLFFILLFYWDLVVPLSSINEVIELVTGCGVYRLINCRQWIAIFRVHLVEVRIVDTHPVFPIYFLN